MSACPSVRLSVKRVGCDKTEERSLQIFIPHERPIRLVFWEEQWLVGVPRLLTEILGQADPVGTKSPIFSRYSFVASAVASIKKGQLTLIRSPPRTFQWASDEHLYVALKPAKGGSKTHNGLFPSKIAICLKKVCYKVSLCENCQWQCCKIFSGLSIHAKMIGGRRPLLRENLADTHRLAKRRFSIYFRS